MSDTVNSILTNMLRDDVANGTHEFWQIIENANLKFLTDDGDFLGAVVFFDFDGQKIFIDTYNGEITVENGNQKTTSQLSADLEAYIGGYAYDRFNNRGA